MQPTWEKIVIGSTTGAADPVRNRPPCWLRDLELNGTLGLLLHNDRAGSDAIAMA
jgi:hypothetical protein